MQRTFLASITLAAGLGAALLSSPASAQPPDPPEPQTVTDGSEPGPRSARRERVHQRIRAMRAWYLTEELDLDDATATRLFPVLSKYDERIAAVHQRGVELRRALRRAMSGSRPDQTSIDRLMDDLLTHYDNLYRVQRDRLVAVRRVMSPSQSARLVLILPRLDDAVRREIERATKKRRRGPGGDRASPLRDRPRRHRGDIDHRPPRRGPPFGDPF
jgi:hypothetical protein